MDELREILGPNTRVEDVQWLCSLKESELDLLTTLKELVIQRAEMIGHPELVQKFDLKKLRVVGLVLMKYFKEKVKGLPQIQVLDPSLSFMGGCNLIKHDLVNALSTEELQACFGTGKRKRVKRVCDDISGSTE